MGPSRRRLDAELVRRGLATGRGEAVALISAGRVLVGGAPADKPARQVAPSEPVVVTGPPARFASRGGEKLDAALDRFGIDVGGRQSLDAGASTGGFTDCLLQRGASRVVAVDVGHGQLLERLRHDPRVEVLEHCNIRSLVPADLGGRRFPVLVADLSFISLRTVAPSLVALAAPGADLVVLVKPQFEAGRADVSRGRGVVRGREVWQGALSGVAAAFLAQGAMPCDAMPSPITGSSGNVEFLLHIRTPVPDQSPAAARTIGADLSAVLEAAIEEAYAGADVSYGARDASVEGSTQEVPAWQS
ncbi:MAG TPA: TlyA family RNA methyltransferase [Acidimicrobiales bacterium]|nr:TlyA family RNA methyltransferase [Acidimicrobiales bacterium]